MLAKSNFTISTESAWTLCVIFCLVAVFLAVPEFSFAVDTENVMEKMLCKVRNTLVGPTGKVIATVGIFFLGIGLFLGKISWGIAIAVGLGIAAIFGADTIIKWASGTDVTGTNYDCSAFNAQTAD
jgi:type IV secretory pathway VirB2 component (pilin)